MATSKKRRDILFGRIYRVIIIWYFWFCQEKRAILFHRSENPGNSIIQNMVAGMHSSGLHKTNNSILFLNLKNQRYQKRRFKSEIGDPCSHECHFHEVAVQFQINPLIS